MTSKTKTEFGDFQTPLSFCDVVTSLIHNKYLFNPDFILEPTLGLGHFVVSSVKEFPSIKQSYGIDINDNYISEAKKTIGGLPGYHFICCSAFSADYESFNKAMGFGHLLCIGNPPWATNSELSNIESNNLPEKNNIKHSRGFDAISGKSNFDIAESILIILFSAYRKRSNTLFAFLVKGIVARNLFRDKGTFGFNFHLFDVYHFDAKKVFGVSCDAVLMVCQFSDDKLEPISFASEFDINFPHDMVKQFGFVSGTFVSDVQAFKRSESILGKSQIEWRQGVKHDCSKVMELTMTDGRLTNNLGENCDSLLCCSRLFPLVKSSEVKGGVKDNYKHYVIVTQDKAGQDTSFLKKDTQLWTYLQNHLSYFLQRKSIIYKKAPNFAIFGVGEYSFANYKIAISGFYKKPAFTYLRSSKPVMADDTCYFVGTNNLEMSYLLFAILDNKTTYDYLLSSSFPDSKRPFTKDILQTIDFYRLSILLGYQTIYLKIKQTFGFEIQKTMFSSLLDCFNCGMLI